MQKTLRIIVLLMLTAGAGWAQSREVTGTVVDQADGTPVPGVNVIAKGTSAGTATDAEGRFRLQVPPGSNILVISAIGYATQEVDITSLSTVNITLLASSSELEEVVVTVGRGSQRTITDTPLPVDNFTSRDLATTGQFTFDRPCSTEYLRSTR